MIAPLFMYLMVAASVLSAQRSSPGDNPSRRIEAIPTMSSRMLDLRAGGLITKEKGAIPQSIMDLSDSSCGHLYTQGYLLMSAGDGKASYDTLRQFMEQCPFWSQGGPGGENAWQGFSSVSGAVSEWTDGGAGRWPDFLAWLKKVLYLNPDSNWYCWDVNDMITALQKNEAAQMSVLSYILSTNRCPTFRDAFTTLYNSASHWRHQYWIDSIVSHYQNHKPGWQDSVKADTLLHPYDSTIPSLYQEDLQLLLGQQNGVYESSGTLSGAALISVSLLNNPLENEIVISYEMSRTALISMELRNVLGQSIPIENMKYQLEQPGVHTLRLPVPNLPAGTYYLRVSTDGGEAKTVKIVNE